MRSKYESASRQIGKLVPQLEGLLELPNSMRYIWKYFIDLHNKRTSNGFGMNPLVYSDIYSYFKLIKVQPEEYELELITQLDRIALDAYRVQAEQENKKNAK